MARFAMAVALFALVGCDQVFGLTGSDLPRCDLASFEHTTPIDVGVAASVFSFDEARSFAVIEQTGSPFEYDKEGPVPIDLGLSAPMLDVAVAPQGDRAFYSFSIEPPIVMSAKRLGRGQWQLKQPAPKGSIAGTPSATQLGARILVRLRPALDEYAEYEEVAGAWKVVGEVHTIATAVPPNLSPNGLTMVYAGQVEGMPAVLAAQRPSLDEWFREPIVILPGLHTFPQLSADCTELHVTEPDMPLGDGVVIDHYRL